MATLLSLEGVSEEGVLTFEGALVAAACKNYLSDGMRDIEDDSIEELIGRSVIAVGVVIL